jgi:hypothetical protein
MEARLDERRMNSASSNIYEFQPSQGSQEAQKRANDAILLYPHVVRMAFRMISRQGMDDSAANRMDASVLLEKFITANAEALSSTSLMESLARDLELPDGPSEAEALVGLSRLRGRKEELRQISWRSFVLIFPSLRASGFNNLSAVNEVLEI